MLMRNPPLCPFSFINKEATGCINEESIRAINEAAVDAIIAPGHPRSCFFISCFTVSVAPSINRPNFFSDPTTLIIPFMSLFEVNKVNPFLALATPCLLIFLSNI